MSQDTLFPEESQADPGQSPLAVRMRPRNLEEFVGQEAAVGPKTLLNRAIRTDRVTSLIVFGPPGTGKTSIASIIALHTSGTFLRINAVTSNVHDVRRILLAAREQKKGLGRKTILFVDEIHRFNKAQQDAFMEDVEEGNLVLVGATTRNPFFALSPPLLSRSLVVEFKPLSGEDIGRILKQALCDPERGYGKLRVSISRDALGRLVRASGNDARRALNALEIAVTSVVPDEKGTVRVTRQVADSVTPGRNLRYDRDEDEHYDHISAFIKSVRGSDPDAAVYYLARMLESGEDPRFIARRLVILASEDIGNAEPHGLPLAVAAMQACEFTGMPEARIILAQATTFLACAPKSNAAYLAIEKAASDLAEKPVLPVPGHLREAGYRGADKLERGIGYLYPHDFPGHYAVQAYLAEPRVYYRPSDEGREKEFARRLEELRRFGTVFREKEELRRKVLSEREAFPADKAAAAAERIRKCLSRDPEFQKAEVVALYASIRKEVATGALIDQALEAGKTVCLPRTEEADRMISFHAIGNRRRELQPGRLEIPEPLPSCPVVEASRLDMIVVPGIAFDESGNRLGFGEGHFDRYLEGIRPGTPVIALAYEFQVRREELPVLPKDVRIGKIITEERIIDTSRQHNRGVAQPG